MKYLGVNLEKLLHNLHAETYTVKKIKEDLDKWRAIMYHGLEHST